MLQKIFFQFFLLSLVKSDWVEIKVVNKGITKIDEPKISTSTPASYEAILVRPQDLFEISATTPFLETDVPQFQEALFSVVLPNSTSKNFLLESESLRESPTPLTDNERVQKTEEYYLLQEDNIYTNNSFSKITNDRGDDNENYVEVEETSEVNEPFKITSVLKHVQQILLNNRGKSFGGKLKLLKNLRDNLLYEIKSRMFELWQPSTPQNRTEARGYKEYYSDDHYHMDFPSNEGALMTIGFLTFAVFLIKLVLKLIYTLKYKQQYYFQTTTTTAASVFLKRNQRDVTQEQLEQSAKILQYIEEYPLS